MMHRKLLGYLAGALVVLIAVSYFTSKRRFATAEDGGFSQLFEEPVDAGAIESIRAWIGAHPDSTVQLARSGDGWMVPTRWDWPAKDDQVTRLMDDLSALKGEKRSSREDILADFELDEEKGLHVVGETSGGNEIFHLVVGKTAIGGGCFVRRSGSSDAYLTQAGLRGTFGVYGDEPKPPDAKRWIDLQVFKAERNDVDRVSLTASAGTIVLEKFFDEPEEEGGAIDRTKWTWKDDDAGEFDKGIVDGVLGTLCSIYATEPADPANEAEYGLGEGARVAELVFADGETKRIFFGGSVEGESQIYVRVGEDGKPARIHESSANRIFKARDDLKPRQT